ncbi:MAG: BatD family protein [Clostridium sp.]|nr:BatD family protein [Prevotella sp.]MCM1428182.1 BatD family protein [Clostridium sp.]MCM1475913.1 BatD family protein [Muribaculaceae bacterium]
MSRRFSFFIFLFLLITFPVFSTVRVRMESPSGGNRVAVGQKFRIIITGNGSGDFQVSNPRGAEVIYQVGNSESINGRTEGEFTLTLLATSPGTFTYSASLGRERSNVLTYKITDSSGNTPQAEPHTSTPDPSAKVSSGPQFVGKGNENMFLRASVSNTSPYEQQAIVYTIKLYTSYNYIKFLGATAAPKFDGFVVEEDNRSNNVQQSFETVNGRTYKASVVARYIIFPQKAGKLTVKGNTYTISADAMEYYQDDYYQRMVVKRPVQLNITPNDLVIDVKSLPTPRPADFSGGVGKFSISSSLPSQQYKTNQAANIVYTVSGQGNLKYVKLPDLNSLFPSQLEVFTPQSEVNAQVNGSNVSGNVKFTCSFMPTETGTFDIPTLKFVYFNPESGKYETAECKGYKITVGQGSDSDKSQSVRHFNAKILPIENLSFPSSPYILNFIFWLWFIIPGAILLIAFIAYIRYMKIHSDMTALKSRRAARIAKKRLRKAAVCLKNNDSDKFFDEMLSALWGYMAHKLKMPTSELTRQNILEMLTSHGVSEQTATKAISLLDDCEFAKYSPSGSSEGMRRIYEEGESVISSLDNEFSKTVIDNNIENDDEIF